MTKKRRTERIRFEGAHGDKLAARLELPVREPEAFALFAHCFTCGKDLKGAVRISRALAARGIAVLRFDFTGIGESEGDFADTNFSSNLEDLLAAADYLRRKHRAPSILVGHSLGGAAVLAVARKVPEARAVATIAAPSDTLHLRETLLDKAPELESEDDALVDVAGRNVRIRRQLLEDLESRTLERCVAELDRALLIFHSPADVTVGIDHARKLFEAARHPKSFVSLDDADHLLIKREADAVYVGEVLAAWASRYLESARKTEDREDAQGRVLVRGGAHGYAQTIDAGRHRLRADEPESVGGSDTGPTPYDLLLAGLGACTSMTLRMYAERKEWPLGEIQVELQHGKIHAEDCADCETKEGKVDHIDVEIALEGDLDKEQRRRLLEIAGRCPVHRTLTSEIKIEERLAEEGGAER